MGKEEIIKKQLDHVLTETNLFALGEKYEGKVRDCYAKDDSMYIITSDRISCFDKVITSIPFKGQVLTDLAMHWFELAKDIAPNHIIDRPDPNVMHVKKCEIFPIEIVVRGYLTGSAWRDYKAGRDVSGIKLPEGMKESQKFDKPLITPSTKEAKGKHDLPISEEEIIKQGIVSEEMWQKARNIALDLFELGQKECEKQGLILVDTKYELGTHNGELLIADEIHTLDSSRFWLESSYQEKFEAGESPDMLDKEVVRKWLMDKGFMGDGEIPNIPDEYRLEVANHYISSYEKITGKDFIPSIGDIENRIQTTLGI